MRGLLQRVGHLNYADNMIKMGLDSIPRIAGCSAEDLDACGVRVLHRKTFINEARRQLGMQLIPQQPPVAAFHGLPAAAPVRKGAK